MILSAELVATYVAAHRGRPHAVPIPPAHRPGAIADGYRLQHAMHEALTAAGIRRIGYKVGCTSKPGQRVFGLDEPIYSGMFSDTQAPDLAAALARPLVAPSLECEIAFRLGRDLDTRATPISRAMAMDAIGTCCIACEIIDNRYDDPAALGVPTLLADDFFHALFVLGADNPHWRDLAWTDLDAAIDIDGAIATGHSGAVLDAVTSLQWLATRLAQTELALHAGDIVLTGSIVPPTPIARPVGKVQLSITGFTPLEFAPAPGG